MASVVQKVTLNSVASMYLFLFSSLIVVDLLSLIRCACHSLSFACAQHRTVVAFLKPHLFIVRRIFLFYWHLRICVLSLSLSLSSLSLSLSLSRHSHVRTGHGNVARAPSLLEPWDLALFTDCYATFARSMQVNLLIYFFCTKKRWTIFVGVYLM